MRGRRISLSVPRRMISDLMYFGARTPIVSVERVMDLGAVIAARDACPDRPPWAAILAKAYALTAQEIPELRRVFLKLPWPRIYEYPTSVAAITVSRMVDGEAGVFVRLVKAPEAMCIVDLADIIHNATQVPITEIREFRRILQIQRLPTILRRLLWRIGLNVGRWRGRIFGTFIVTSVAHLGTGALFTPTPTNMVSIDVFKPDGRVALRYLFDHRVFDGVVMANALARLEEILNGPILGELRAMSKPSL
jgi:hypothetical protein